MRGRDEEEGGYNLKFKEGEPPSARRCGWVLEDADYRGSTDDVANVADDNYDDSNDDYTPSDPHEEILIAETGRGSHGDPWRF